MPLLALLAIFCTGCSHKTSPAPQQAQAPPLQTGKGTLRRRKTRSSKRNRRLRLLPPCRHRLRKACPCLRRRRPKRCGTRSRPTPAKPADTAQTPAATSGAGSTQSASSGSQASAQSTVPQQPAAERTAASSPIGQLTTGDSAEGEKTKHETADLIGETQQGLNGIKRPLSAEEKVTATQIRTFLKQAQQALDNGDTDGAHTLATKAKLLLDELTKP